MSADEYVDKALELLGGEEEAFYLTAREDKDHPGRYLVYLQCRILGCKWGYTVGEMPLWEFATDAREHWDERHASE